MKQILRLVLNIIIDLLFSLLLFGIVTESSGWPDDLQNRIISSGRQDTGASNLVAAVYLSYRAFDTLGETIVLLLAVSGLLFLLEKE